LFAYTEPSNIPYASASLKQTPAILRHLFLVRFSEAQRLLIGLVALEKLPVQVRVPRVNRGFVHVDLTLTVGLYHFFNEVSSNVYIHFNAGPDRGLLVQIMEREVLCLVEDHQLKAIRGVEGWKERLKASEYFQGQSR